MKRSMLDSLDKTLVKLLQTDARQNSNALAKHLGVNSSTIRRRIEKLLKDEVIRFVVIPDPKKIGLPLQAVVAFDVAEDMLKSVLEKLGNLEEVQWLTVTTGRFDVLASIWVPSTEELFHFLEEFVAKLEGVRNTETFICLHVEKHR